MVTIEQVKGMKVQELKDELKALGLDIKGLKADLQKRLEDHLVEASKAAVNVDTTTSAAPEGGPVAITAEVDGEVPAETIAEVAQAAAQEIAAEAEKEAPAGDQEAELVEKTTTITVDAEGTVDVNSKEEVVPVSEATEAPTEVKTQAIQEAVVDAVEAASTAAEVEEKPATAVTTVEETKVGDDVIMETAVATGEGQGVQESAAPASDAPAAEAAKSPAIVQTYRLFVGCVPTQMNEKELSESFTGVEGFKEVSILRDSVTGTSRGCAFAVYDSKQHAEEAIDKLNKQLTLPGGTQPMEVRFAKEPNKIMPSTEPNDQNKLFFARAPTAATEKDLKDTFSEFGEVTEVAIFMNRPANTSKGCGFISFSTRDQAQAAIDNLHDKKVMDGAHGPLTVKWADVELGAKKRKAMEESQDPNRENCQLFFAKIPRNVTEEELTNVFSTVAPVKDLVIFKAHSAATTNKGCGIVTLKSHAEAVEVLDKLHDTHKLEGMDACMVLKWVDQDLQKRRKVGPDEGPMGGPGGRFGGPQQWGSPYGPPGGPGMGDEERPPQGCAPDTYKLFLANIPKNWDIPELRNVLDGYGQVVESNLVRDKQTKAPKGVAFAWFRTRAQADKCIRELNQKLFDDGTGTQKPISVAKARARRTSGGPGGYGGQGGGYPGGGYGARPGAYQQGQGRPYGGQRPQSAPYQQQQQGYYQQPQQAAAAYDPYSQQSQPQQQAQYNYQAQTGYQQPAYSQPAAYGQQTSYQQPAAASTYNYQAQSTPQQQAYGQTANTYSQQYAAPQQAAATYTNPTATPAYSTATTGYGTQQTAGYGQQTSYAAPAVQSYGTTQQYSAAQTSQAPSTGYTYTQPAAAQTSYATTGQADTNTYNYGTQAGYTQQTTGGYNYGQQTQ